MEDHLKVRNGKWTTTSTAAANTTTTTTCGGGGGDGRVGGDGGGGGGGVGGGGDGGGGSSGGGDGLVDGIISLFQSYSLFMMLFQLDRLYMVKFNGIMSMKS